MGSLVAFIPAINAMVGGILVVAGIAYGIKAGVDYFSGAEEREIKNKREALIQKILLNQQEKINLLNEDMNLLTERLTNAIVDVEKNSQMIQKIKERLELFQNALKSSKNKLEADQLEAKKLQTA
jgi:chromosome segregation ATPase